MLEQVAIPEALTSEEREPFLRTLMEYVHSIKPSKLFRYRECSEMQFDAFITITSMLLLQINLMTRMIAC